MPGFKNAHAHSAMTFLRSYADDLPLQSWLFDKVFPLEARLTPEAVYAFTRLAILEYLAGGITASFDMYFYRDAYARANIDWRLPHRDMRCALRRGQNIDRGGRLQEVQLHGRAHKLPARASTPSTPRTKSSCAA